MTNEQMAKDVSLGQKRLKDVQAGKSKTTPLEQVMEEHSEQTYYGGAMPTLNSKFTVEVEVSAEYYFAEEITGFYHRHELSEIKLSIDYESQDGPTRASIRELILEDIKQKKREAQSGTKV